MVTNAKRRHREWGTRFGSLALVLALLAGALAAEAQPAGKVYRIGFLSDSPAVFPDAIEAFRQGLRDLGYVEGRNIVIEYRWTGEKPERMRELAEELVRLKVYIIVAPGSNYTGVVKRSTSTIPIIFLSHADPLGTGHVASLARPGGNASLFRLAGPATFFGGGNERETPYQVGARGPVRRRGGSRVDRSGRRLVAVSVSRGCAQARRRS